MKNLAVQDLTHEAFTRFFFRDVLFVFLPSHKTLNWEANHNNNIIPVFCFFFLKFFFGVRNEDIHSDPMMNVFKVFWMLRQECIFTFCHLMVRPFVRCKPILIETH